MSRRKQDRPQHLATADATEDPASEMNSQDDVGGIERSTVSEAFGGREISPGSDASDAETTFTGVPLEGQMPESNNDLEICDPDDSLEGEHNFDSSPMSEDNDSLKCEADQNCGPRDFDFPLNVKDPKIGKQYRHLAQPRDSVLEIERDSEGNVGFDSFDGDQLLPVGESRTSGNIRRPSNTGYCAINAESHVTKLQSFVDSLAKLTEPSYAARSQQPPSTFLPQYPKITPTKASGCMGSYSGSSGVRPGFPYFGYQSRADDHRGLAATTTTPVSFSNPLECQPLDLSTRKQHAGFVNQEGRGDSSSDIASPEVRRRCFERSERLQTEFLRQRPSYNDPGTQNGSGSRSDLDHATSSTRSVSFSAGHNITRNPPEEKKHRSSDAGLRYKRERTTVGSFADLESSKMAGNTYHTKKSEIAYRKETKQHESTDDRQRVVSGKRKYSTFDEGSAHGGGGLGGGEHSPGSETIQKCQRQSTRCSGNNNSDERGEGSTALQPIKEDREYMNMRCSCGTRFESLYELAIHIERSGHVPGILRPESLADLPKLVRGQDVWMSQGPEQAEMILRCVQCKTSFGSLPELTVHMIRTKHYVNIVGTDGLSAGGQMDYGDPPSREKESPQRGIHLRDSKRKSDAYVSTCTARESERAVDMMGQLQRSQKSKSPRLNNEANEISVGMKCGQGAVYSGRNQLDFQSTVIGRDPTEEMSEVEHEFDQCQEKEVAEKQLPAAASEKEVGDPTAVVVDESKDAWPRADTHGGDQSSRRHSLASKLHSKISSVTGNAQERIGSNKSANSTNTNSGARCSARQGSNRSKTRALQDVSRVPESIRDPGVKRFSAEEHSSAGGGVLRIQSPDNKHAVKSFEPLLGHSGVKENDGNRRNKRPGDVDYETENDRTEEKKKSKNQCTSWKSGHQFSKDSSRFPTIGGDRQPETGPSTQDLRKERMLLNVSRWIASTELETKGDYCGDETQLEDLNPIDNRLELVSPPSQPVETSSILVAIKNFVDSSFCGQTFAASGSQISSNRTTFPGCSSYPNRNPVPTGRNIPEMNHTLNLTTTPGAPHGDDNACESPSWISPMKRNPHMDAVAQVPPDPTERRRPTRPTTSEEEKFLRRIDVDGFFPCKEPLAVALKVNTTEQNTEEDYPEGQRSIGDPAASPLWNRNTGYSDSRNIKCEEGSEVQSEYPQGSYHSGSETEEEGESAGPNNDITATQHAPFPQLKPSEDSPDAVELEECSHAAAQSVDTISIQQTDNHEVDSTAKSPKPPGSPPPGIVPDTFPLPDTDPLRDCDRKSISKPISFFLSSRSFEKVC